MDWQPVYPQVWLWPDSCNVYAVEGPDGIVLINAGTGRWLEALAVLPKPPVALACTHYFRDHSAGAALAGDRGIPIYVPEYERAVFADPDQHFRARETYIIYENAWHHFAPIRAVKVAGVLQDYVRVNLGGIDWEIVPLPGVTQSQVGLACRLPGGEAPLVFCGEAIHSPGRMARLAPLQYNYNDLPGAVNAFCSAGKLRVLAPTALFPSLGTPILEGIDGALAMLQDNLRTLCEFRPGMTEALDRVFDDDLVEITPHLWRNPQTWALTHFLISRSGKVLALDYGYRHSAAFHGWTHAASPLQRRAHLHSLAALKHRFGIERIDVVLVSHFHDDHVCGIPLLQRLHGTECWASETFAHLLQQPEGSAFPCTWPQPINVQRALGAEEEFTWEEYTFRVRPMSGHTRFSSWIEFSVDGRRYAHTGDQYFFTDASESHYGTQMASNQVFRNGALLDSYAQSAEYVLAWRPEIVLQGHQPVFYTDEAFFERVRDWGRDFDSRHRQAGALADDEPHFNLDGWGGWIWPYRSHLVDPGEVRISVTVRNPLPEAATLEVRLTLPAGWTEPPILTLTAGARAEVTGEFVFTVNVTCRRQAYAVELVANGRPFGQVCEALLTAGYPEF